MAIAVSGLVGGVDAPKDGQDGLPPSGERDGRLVETEILLASWEVVRHHPMRSLAPELEEHRLKVSSLRDRSGLEANTPVRVLPDHPVLHPSRVVGARAGQLGHVRVLVEDFPELGQR